MRVLLIAVALMACRPKKPTPPPPSVFIARTNPVVGERCIYTVRETIKMVASLDANTIEAIQETDTQTEEIITGVRGWTVTDRTVRFIAFHHKPLIEDAPLQAPVVGKTYRVGPNRTFTSSTGEAISAAETAALEASVRSATGEPELATYLLTERSFTKGVPWNIPSDLPAPFARGQHAGSTITFVEMAGTKVRFEVTQTVVLKLGSADAPTTLKGEIVVDIGTSRIDSIDFEGHATFPDGRIREAHFVSQQTFAYPR